MVRAGPRSSAIGGPPDVVERLLVHGADPNVADAKGVTPLLAAARSRGSDAVAVVGLLLDHGASPTAVDSTYHLTAAEIAKRAGDPAVAQVFLSRGATDPEVDLFEATQAKDLAAATQALDRGANPNSVRNGRTALRSVIQRRDLEMLRMMLGRGADPAAMVEPGRRSRRRCGRSGRRASTCCSSTTPIPTL